MRAAALLAIPLALGAIIAPGKGAQAGTPAIITACRTISQPGSYLLGNNLSNASGNCLVITASFVTIDLEGFSIIGRPQSSGIAITASADVDGITVRNGSISGFGNGVELPGHSSIVEGLRVLLSIPSNSAITANGIVKDNIASAKQIGISAGGIVTGNYASAVVETIQVSAGSTVIGNTVTSGSLVVNCPSNVTNNTVIGGLFLNGTGCKNTNNVVSP